MYAIRSYYDHELEAAVLGTCTDGSTFCDEASDCPPGEGCCGDLVVTAPEECDDGNGIDDDASIRWVLERALRQGGMSPTAFSYNFV